jgi:hypothetical protein
MELAPDFDELIGCLNARGVEFLVVGAYALAFHGAPRFTGDFDVWIRPALDSGVTWDEAWPRRVPGPCGRQVVAFLGRDAFLQNKRAAGRPKDLADIDALREGEP